MSSVFEPGHRFSLENLVFPQQSNCWICQKDEETGVDGLCSHCRETAVRHEGNLCPYCGRHVDTPGFCLDCRSRPPVYRHGIVLYQYQGSVRHAIQQAKYANNQRTVWEMGRILSAALLERQCLLPDLIVPMPMSWLRRIRRGCNVTEVAARAVSEVLGIPWYRNALRHKLFSRLKFGMQFEERLVKEIKVFPDREIDLVKGKRVLLLDDIITTGTTMNQTAQVLLEHGCKEVISAALAGNS